MLQDDGEVYCFQLKKKWDYFRASVAVVYQCEMAASQGQINMVSAALKMNLRLFIFN